jgi:NADPH-dependent curcumin reductase CurA
MTITKPDTPTEIPPFMRPDRNRRVLLFRRPTGIPQPDDFVRDEVAVPEPAEGQILVRNIYLSVDPAQRGWALAEANYSNPVALGTPMRALAVGVVAASRSEAFEEGEFLYGWFDWQDYAVVDASKVLARAREAVPLAAFAGLLGINGLTAYLALMDLGRPKGGETLLVSTAAGAVGSIVGQIGKIVGCRTIGLTGEDVKVELCRYRFGYDEAVNYRTSDIGEAVRARAPGGVDVFFDNTGGAILDAGLRQMKAGGRVIQCGTASVSSWSPSPQGMRNEREVLTRRLTWSGFIIFDHFARFAEAATQLAQWYKQGLIVTEHDIIEGIDHAPNAIADLYAGRNMGKRLIYVG